ncbi:histidine kinase [Microbacterium sp. M28]|uniref:sensor histidine kinase n=1 Tax=Microbacterium sp. M28 TaxID=2962064 RepID=UPI0021F42CD2|nr:sensor histidine kinase [Microbacterium sp. M28]UYO97237.1 histidine kinase [Microbacterium sp. M28]
MSSTSGRSSSAGRIPAQDPATEELRLPRPPGMIRRFWARHPLFADILIALVCLVMSITPAVMYTTDRVGPDGAIIASSPPPIWASIAISVLVFAACALLLRRRRWPTTVLIASYIVAVVYLLVLDPAGGPLLLVSSYGMAVYRSSRAAWTAFGIGIGGLTLLAAALQLAGAITLQAAANAVLGQLTLALIGTLIGANVGGRKRYVEAIIDRSRQLLNERDQQAQIAAAAERARIAREMHDVVSHSLTVIVALSEGAAATSDPERAKDASVAAAATARGALSEMRSMLGVLREGDADAPLAPTAPVDPRTTVAAAQRAGFPVTLSVSGEAGAAEPVEFAIGRVVQEGVTNAMRHAPRASAVSVRIDRRADPLVVQIVNDGVAAAPAARSGGFGLTGLAERTAHLGGTLDAGVRDDGRWVLRAEFPAGGADPGEKRSA